MADHTRGELVVVATPADLADAAARYVVELARAAIEQRGSFSIALSGGSTPRALHQRLARPPLSAQIDWPKLLVFWSDERWLPPDDHESNFRLARETLLDHVPIPAANIFAVPTVGGTPQAAAATYAATLASHLPDQPPQLDLIVLGMGPDGHTASLFPGQAEPAAPGTALVIAVANAPKPPPDRISFSYRLINAARNVLFLVAGADKAATLHAVLHGPLDQPRLPAQGVFPTHGRLTWLVDAAAASALQR